MAKVTVALSGGVDSSVAAALLQEQGHQVEGVFMKNWSPESIQGLTDCPWEQDQADAAAVCAHLGIPFRSINFEREYRDKVVQYFLDEYQAGHTPNPDVMCNKEIKFTAFLSAARSFGAEYIATGHYAQVRKDGGQFQLWRGNDPKKDQSYFLYTLTQDQLSQTLFPVGGMAKPAVRLEAERFGLPTAKKKDSQGICFIGHLDLRRFLQEHLQANVGEVRLLPHYDGVIPFGGRLAASQVIGRHGGGIFYTIGQRVGEAVDNGLYRLVRGRDVPPLYVLEKQGNELYVTDDSFDPHFVACEVVVDAWSTPLPVGKKMFCQARYQQKPIPVTSVEGTVVLAEDLRCVALGQALVMYSPDGQVYGGGTVVEVRH